MIKDEVTIEIKGHSYPVKFPTVGQFYQIEAMKQSLSRGFYNSMVMSPSVQAQHALDMIDIEAAIVLLGESIARRMRRKALLGNTVTLKLKYSWGAGKTIQRRLPHPTDDENVFVPVALSLLSSVWSEGMHVRLAGIGMSDFNHQGGIQTDLFCEIDDRGAQSSDRRDLSVAIDAVRDKFGDTALSFGRQSRFND